MSDSLFILLPVHLNLVLHILQRAVTILGMGITASDSATSSWPTLVAARGQGFTQHRVNPVYPK